MLPVASIALALVGTTSFYHASVSAEGRTGVVGPGAPLSSELELDPAAAVGTALAKVNLLAQYGPRLLQAAGRLSVFHNGHLGAEWTVSSGLRLLLDEHASYGDLDYSPLSSSNFTSRLDARLPQVRFVDVYSLRTTAGFELAISRRLSIGLVGGFGVSGGANEQARLFVPLEHGVLLSTHATWKAAGRETFAFRLSGDRSRFSNGLESQVATVLAAWTHEFSRQTQGDLGLGLGLSRTLGADRDLARTEPSPVATAGLRHRMPSLRLVGTANVSFEPSIDRVNGTVYNRADLSASLEHSPTKPLVLSAWGGRSMSLSGPARGESVTRLGAGASYSVGPRVRLACGVRTAWESDSVAASFLRGPAWTASVSLMVSEQGRL